MVGWRECAWTAVTAIVLTVSVCFSAIAWATQPQLSHDDLDAFFDGVLSQRMERDDLAGAAVAIVKDGSVVFEKGYGYADVAKKTPVSPQETVFGIASISKTFTATAVMQLVTTRQLDLDVDVQQYLDFQLVKAFPEPITLRRLLTHTAGFEEGGKDDLDDPKAISKLGPFLATHQPAQIFRPGARIAYSNYGNSLAGYVVERVAKQPYAAYIAQHIYQPLGMKHSTFEAPLPKDLASLASQEYWRASQPPRPLEYLGRRPAGGMFSTADDMARYMIAHLQEGRYQDQQILTEQAARTLHTIQWRAHPDGLGIALAFYQSVGNGRFVLTHGGDLACQHSELWLIPSEHLGVFMIFNTTGTDWTRLRAAIWKAFVDRYLPPLATGSAASSPTSAADARAVAGSYLTTRRSQTNFLSLAAFLQPLRVTANPDHSISMEGATDYAGVAKKYFPVGNLLYREADGHTLGFIRDEHGKVIAMIADGVGEFELEQGLIGGHAQAIVLMLAVGLIILSLVMWPIAAFARHRYQRRLRDELDADAYKRKRIVRGTVVVAVVLITLAGVYLADLAQLKFEILSATTDPYIRLFQLLAIIVIIGSVHAVWSAVVAWRRAEGALSHRLAATVTGGSLAILSCFLLAYPILAFKLAY